jgi:rieske iron-sulfur protein
MKSKFCKERRDLLKTTCALAGATAMASLGSVNSFAAGGGMPLPQAKGAPVKGDSLIFSDGPNKGKEVSVTDVVLNAPPILVMAKDPATGKVREDEGDTDHAAVLLYRVAAEKIPADLRGDTVDGIIGYSGCCTHLGCVLSNWDAANKQFLCPCHDATFDPMQGGKNTGGATARELPQVPVAAKDGKLIVANRIVGWVGVKRGSYF